MEHIMIDLETLGTGQDAAFIAIGACQFDLATGKIGSSFYSLIDWNSATADREHDWSTVKWWMAQNESARLEITKEGDDLLNVMEAFTNWFPDDGIAWGNGATFDIAILENYYSSIGHIAPWKFWNVRDVRTVVDMAKGIVDKSDVAFIGSAHNALDDAKHQAKYVSAMWHALRNGR